MRPEKVSEWREKLPAPFNHPSDATLRRRSSTNDLSWRHNSRVPSFIPKSSSGRRNSAGGAVDQPDRKLHGLLAHLSNSQSREQRQSDAGLAVEKLRTRAKRFVKHSLHGELKFHEPVYTKTDTQPDAAYSQDKSWHPSRGEISALAAECFPTMSESKVIITDYWNTYCRSAEYTLEEVLASEYILRPPTEPERIRWIHVEYYKTGCFWASDLRFSQWATDPELFEKSPIPLLQTRIIELETDSNMVPVEAEDLTGHKRIGKYYREVPGCPEYLGLRVSSAQWFETEQCKLLLAYLDSHPAVANDLQQAHHIDLEYCQAYINGVNCLRKAAYEARPGLRDVHEQARKEEVYVYGSWDDHVERLEFHRADTLMSCGSPRLYKVAADRLARPEDCLRRHPDAALLYYTLARISIENDEMMHDAPERALNKIFAGLKSKRATDREHVELIFSLQQTVLDGLEYLEENKRELPIWGIPPFTNHLVNFHPDHSPAQDMRKLIQHEMNLVDKNFDTIIQHWKVLKSKVDRHLDVLLQFRVLEQQELAVEQRNLATKQQNLAVQAAKRSGVQARSILVFTALTVVFLPLTFFTSYFGMELKDITTLDSKFFWTITGPISFSIILIVFALVRALSAMPGEDEEKLTRKTKDDETWATKLRLRAKKLKLK